MITYIIGEYKLFMTGQQNIDQNNTQAHMICDSYKKIDLISFITNHIEPNFDKSVNEKDEMNDCSLLFHYFFLYKVILVEISL